MNDRVTLTVRIAGRRLGGTFDLDGDAVRTEKMMGNLARAGLRFVRKLEADKATPQ